MMSRYINELIGKIERYRLDRYPFWRQIRFAADRRMLSEQMAKAFLQTIENHIQRQKDFPNLLHRAPTESELHQDNKPEIILGHLVEDPTVPFGLRLSDRPRNLIVAGAAGSGKTVTLRNICFKVHEYNQQNPTERITLIVIDPKQDFSDLRAKLGSDWLYFSVHDNLRLGLDAPPDVPPGIWINQITTWLAARLGLIISRTTLAKIVHWALAILNPNPKEEPLTWPSLKLILEIVLKAGLLSFSSKADYSKTLIQLLEGVLQDSGSLLDCANGFQIREIIQSGKNCVIDVSNLPDYLLHYLLDCLIGQELVSRLHNRHKTDRTEIMYLLDEGDLAVHPDSERAFHPSLSPLSAMARLGRELGMQSTIGISALQNVAPHLLSSACYRMIFNLSDAESVITARRALLLEPGAELMLTALKPGECLFRESQGPWPHTVWCQVDYIPPGRMEIDSLQYNIHAWKEAHRLAELPQLQEALDQRSTEHEQGSARQRIRAKGGTPLNSRARSLLDYASLHPCEPVHLLFKRIDNPSPAIQKAVVSELSRKGLAQFEKVRLSHSSVRLIAITEKGWKFLAKKPPRQGRGGIVHRHFVSWVMSALQKRRYAPKAEGLVPGTRHAADLIVELDGKITAYEIVTETRDNLTGHIKSCFIDSDAVEQLVIVASQKSICKELEKMVYSDLVASHYSERITFETIDTYLKEAF